MSRLGRRWPLWVTLALVVALAGAAWAGRPQGGAEGREATIRVTAFGHLGKVRHGAYTVSIGLRVDNNGRRSLVMGPRRFVLLDDADGRFRMLEHGKAAHTVTPLPRQVLFPGRSLVGWLIFLLPAGDPPQALLFRVHGRERRLVLQTTPALEGQYPAPPTVTPPPGARRPQPTTGSGGRPRSGAKGSASPAPR